MITCYRSAPCASCESPARASCPRCQAQQCAAHGVHGPGADLQGRWCTTCEAERVDEIAFARAEVTLRSPTYVDDKGMSTRNLMTSVNLVSLCYHVISRPFRKRAAQGRAEKAFAARPAWEIQEIRGIAAARKQAWDVDRLASSSVSQRTLNVHPPILKR